MFIKNFKEYVNICLEVSATHPAWEIKGKILFSHDGEGMVVSGYGDAGAYNVRIPYPKFSGTFSLRGKVLAEALAQYKDQVYFRVEEDSVTLENFTLKKEEGYEYQPSFVNTRYGSGEDFPLTPEDLEALVNFSSKEEARIALYGAYFNEKLAASSNGYAFFMKEYGRLLDINPVIIYKDSLAVLAMMAKIGPLKINQDFTVYTTPDDADITSVYYPSIVDMKYPIDTLLNFRTSVMTGINPVFAVEKVHSLFRPAFVAATEEDTPIVGVSYQNGKLFLFAVGETMRTIYASEENQEAPQGTVLCNARYFQSLLKVSNTTRFGFGMVQASPCVFVTSEDWKTLALLLCINDQTLEKEQLKAFDLLEKPFVPVL